MACPTMDGLTGKDRKPGIDAGGGRESEREDESSGNFNMRMDISVSRIPCSENACLGIRKALEGASFACQNPSSGPSQLNKH
ncbi:hypothetical protein Ancab_022135, partial [Ancistrocladus abbreviatus]